MATGLEKDGSGLATCSFRNARLCDAYNTYLPPADDPLESMTEGVISSFVQVAPKVRDWFANT